MIACHPRKARFSAGLRLAGLLAMATLLAPPLLAEERPAALPSDATSPAAATGGSTAHVTKPLPPATNRRIDFVKDVEPIFAARCNYCHGEEKQEGALRLDARAIVLRGGKSGPLFATGKSADSLLIHRLVGSGEQKQMPLEDEPLGEDEIGILRAWIDQGAVWPVGVGSAATEIPRHWAYVAPQSPAIPAVKNAARAAGAVDRFILARLEKAGLSLAAPADKARLLRRVSLDLIGLPPTIEEVDAFLADDRPDAYERQIDRLLASPAYGERWATPWLDAARYADSNGFQRDGHRAIWLYRDWVVQAFNADMPFDRFTIEQIAGDLLPAASDAQKIATGFHRCTTVNVEAGVDQEENRTNQVIDRVNVTGTVWLGTTLECCQCHNHKFDPFTQRDYYQILAYFNNTQIETREQSKGSAGLEFVGPEMQIPPDPATAARRKELAALRQVVAKELEECVQDEHSGLSAWEAEMQASDEERKKLPAGIARILKLPAKKRNAKQRDQLTAHFVSLHPAAKEKQTRMDGLQKEIDALAPPSSLVMVELAEPRMSTIFERGSFLSPGKSVEPGTPAVLHPLADDLPPNRLGLAQWLVDPANPLMARVTVNRAWAQFFGQGIVLSPEDFGTQSEPPTHPALLDYLAVEFRDRGWSLKHVHRLVATSETYRQASAVTPKLLAKDPYNRLYARGPRLRLSAEQIRDNALAACGLLTSKLSGPPVYPPQPDGIWRVTGNVDNTYRTSTGEDRYRRGIYTVQRRSAAYPSFLNFDATDRSACVVKRTRSNTPLQALTLLNDPVYVDLAAALADRVLGDGSTIDPQARLELAFRHCLARVPTETEREALHELFRDTLARYRDDLNSARIIARRSTLKNTDAAEWVAWFHVAQALLNLDETISH
jgi:hypothetical protein